MAYCSIVLLITTSATLTTREVDAPSLNHVFQFGASFQKDNGPKDKSPYIAKLWDLWSIYSTSNSSYSGQTITFPADHFSDQSVDIYILSTGLDEYHAMHVREGNCFPGIKGSPQCTLDDNGLGTDLASITMMVAPLVTIIPVKVCDDTANCDMEDVANGLYWSCREVNSGKAKVVLLPNISTAAANPPLELLIKNCTQEGITVIIPAGDSAEDACTLSPARMRNVVTVGAFDRKNTLANTSNFGACVTLVAPGEGVYVNGDGRTISGTSVAASHVAGACARFLSWAGNVTTPYDVIAWLQKVAIRNQILVHGEKINYDYDRLYVPPLPGKPDQTVLPSKKTCTVYVIADLVIAASLVFLFECIIVGIRAIVRCWAETNADDTPDDPLAPSVCYSSADDNITIGSEENVKPPII